MSAPQVPHSAPGSAKVLWREQAGERERIRRKVKRHAERALRHPDIADVIGRHEVRITVHVQRKWKGVTS